MPQLQRLISQTVRRRLAAGPVVGLLGARQVGKTTLARQVARQWRGAVTWFDLERDEDVRALEEPSIALGGLRGLVVIDEIQHRPALFPALRVLADRPRTPARFLVLGSASPALLAQSAESLAGRISYVELAGLSLAEAGPADLPRLWLRGGFPRSFLAKTLAQSQQWRQDFVRTFVSRDVPALGVRVPAATLVRFWSMLAHVHGQLLNWSELGRSMGVDDHTVRRYVDVLAQTFMIRTLAPWHENIAKRQVKAPKLYFRDSGLLHTLLGVDSERALLGHPRLGASWEGFIIEQLLLHLGAGADEAYFWRTHDGAELDLLVVRGSRRRGYEVKRSAGVTLTPSMRSAVADLHLDSLDVVHAGERTWPLSAGVRAVAASRLLEDIAPLPR